MSHWITPSGFILQHSIKIWIISAIAEDAGYMKYVTKQKGQRKQKATKSIFTIDSEKCKSPNLLCYRRDTGVSEATIYIKTKYDSHYFLPSPCKRFCLLEFELLLPCFSFPLLSQTLTPLQLNLLD